MFHKMQQKKSPSKQEIEKALDENLGLIYFIVRSFKPKRHEYDEYVHLAKIGLWKCLLNFNADKGKLSTIAPYYMRREILNFLRKEKKYKKVINSIEEQVYNQYTVTKEYFPKSLSNEEINIITQKIFYEKSFSEIANIMNTSAYFVKKQYISGLNKIKKELQ